MASDCKWKGATVCDNRWLTNIKSSAISVNRDYTTTYKYTIFTVINICYIIGITNE